MYNHIIPRVLLKQFVENYPKNRIVKYFDTDLKEKQKNIRRTAGEEGFYSDDKELELGIYESKFGEIIKKIKETPKKKFISLTYDEYCILLEFYTIQWRRTKYGILSKKEKIFDFTQNMISIFDKMGFEKLKDYNEELLKDRFEKEFEGIKEEAIDIYEDEYTAITGVMQKSINFYKPFLVVNRTDVHFCLHDKVMTVIGTVDDTDLGLPQKLIYPLTSKLMLVLQRSMKPIKRNVNVNIEVVKMKTTEEVDNTLQNYLLGSSEMVFYINYLDRIKEIYTFKKELMDELGYDNL